MNGPRSRRSLKQNPKLRAAAEIQALSDRDRAISAEQEAISQKAIAEAEAQAALEAYSLSLAGHAQNALDEHDTATALVLALAASRIDNPPDEVQRVLRNAAYEPGPSEKFLVADIFKDVEGEIYSLAASPVENTLLIGFEDGSLVLWNLNTREAIRWLEGHTGKVYDVAFSPDGKTAISGSEDHQVIVWDLETGSALQRLVGHSGWARSVDISPDGRKAVSGGFTGDSMVSISEPGELFLWNLESGEILNQFDGKPTGQPYGIVDAAFSPDGENVLASYGMFSDQQVNFTQILWDVESGSLKLELTGYSHDNYSIGFTPDGKQALTGGRIIISTSGTWEPEKRPRSFPDMAGWFPAWLFPQMEGMRSPEIGTEE